MEDGTVDTDGGLLPGIRRTVRAATVGSDGSSGQGEPENSPSHPGLTSSPSTPPQPAHTAKNTPPQPAHTTKNTPPVHTVNKTPTPPLHRNDTYGSITTSLGEGELESYSPRFDEPLPPGCANIFSPQSVNRFRRKLRFFFMNPYEKWKAKRKFPWKLVLQLVKVILATVQLASFGFSRSSHVNFLDKSNIAFKHLYLKDWAASYETLPYPPATGAYAIYTIPDFYDSINYAMKQYDLTESLAIGTFRFSSERGHQWTPQLCNTHYHRGHIYNDSSYYYDTKVVTDCLHVGPVWEHNTTTKEDEWVYDIKEFLARYNGTFNASINFDSVINLSYRFPLKTVHLKALSKHDKPDCYIFQIDISYENKEHDGQMLVSLESHEVAVPCTGHVAYPNEKVLVVVGSVFDAVLIVISIMSAILCIRSIYRGQLLRREAVRFFSRQYELSLTLGEQMEFLDLWYLLIVINDMLISLGSVVKILIENKVVNSYELCGTTLGTASLLVWFGVLRYLGFFEKYNVLILTLQKSAPNVLRFLLCAIIFYLGFAFCGWVVLGPYHIKFRQISTASECLFALVNGDDMFVTFSIIGNGQNNYVWYYSRLYLYLFISLFIYVVLSVFISVIMDAYETIKYYYEHGFPKSNLMKFVDNCPDDPSSPLYRSDDYARTRDTPSLISRLNCCGSLNCCKRREKEDPTRSSVNTDESTRLIDATANT